MRDPVRSTGGRVHGEVLGDGARRDERGKQPTVSLDDRADRVAVVSPVIERATAVLCGRWKPTLVILLTDGARRRGELDRCLPDDVSPKVLTDQLRGLEADGIVARVDYRALRRRGQRHVTYALTPAGKELSDVVRALAQWGAQHVAGDLDRPGRGARNGDAAVARQPIAAADRPRAVRYASSRAGA